MSLFFRALAGSLLVAAAALPALAPAGAAAPAAAADGPSRICPGRAGVILPFSNAT